MTLEEAKALKSNMHATFDTPQGKEVIMFLERRCCWYDSVFNPTSPDMTLIAAGRREVLATIKTILGSTAEQLVQLEEDT